MGLSSNSNGCDKPDCKIATLNFRVLDGVADQNTVVEYACSDSAAFLQTGLNILEACGTAVVHIGSDLPGDLNEDGCVNARDLVELVTNWPDGCQGAFGGPCVVSPLLPSV